MTCVAALRLYWGCRVLHAPRTCCPESDTTREDTILADRARAPPKELWAMSHVHWQQTAQKRRKKMGSSVAYKTRGTVLS